MVPYGEERKEGFCMGEGQCYCYEKYKECHCAVPTEIEDSGIDSPYCGIVIHQSFC